ncbi:MAG: FkbM family methyltransferase, partial [Planctomycetia bacterium]
DRECRFEVDCASRGMRVFMADRSVAGPPIDDPAFTILRKFLGATADEDQVTLDDWVKHSGVPTGDLLLQMDIEGHEYATLLAAPPALLRRFRVIVVEFHWLDQLWNRLWFTIVSQVFAKLLASHACVHLHPNNCCGLDTTAGIAIPRLMEFTFLRRDRLLSGGPAPSFPHPLDRDNTTDPSLPLPGVWRPTGP